MSESPELLPVTEKKSSCGCHEHSDERLTLDARAIPHRLRHAAVIGAASSLNPGEGFDLVAPACAHPAAGPDRPAALHLPAHAAGAVRGLRPRRDPAHRLIHAPSQPVGGRHPRV